MGKVQDVKIEILGTEQDNEFRVGLGEPGMVVEIAENDDLVRARDQINGGFVQYVRADDLALGEKVAAAGKCGTCHGADYKGVGDVPRLAGQHAVYMIRQLKGQGYRFVTVPELLNLKPPEEKGIKEHLSG